MRKHCLSFRKTIMILSSIFLFHSSLFANDSFFKNVMNKIKKSIDDPLTSYGFKVIDEYTSGKTWQEDISPMKFQYDFYTEQNKIFHRSFKFDAAKPDGEDYYSFRTTVKAAGDNDKLIGAGGGMSGKGGPYILYNNEKRSRFETDATGYYRFDTDTTELEKQPYQMLINPCIANMDLNINDILKSKVRFIGVKDGLRVYEAKVDKYKTAKLYFINSDPTMVVKTDYKIGSRYKSTHSVDKYKTLPDGQIVAIEYSFISQDKIGNKQTILRQIKDVIVGDIDDDQFNPDKLEDFRHDWDEIYDYGSDTVINVKIPDSVLDEQLLNIESIEEAADGDSLINKSSPQKIEKTEDLSVPVEVNSNQLEKEGLVQNNTAKSKEQGNLLWCLILVIVSVICTVIYYTKSRTK